MALLVALYLRLAGVEIALNSYWQRESLGFAFISLFY